MNACVLSPFLRQACGCLMLGLLAWTTGCSKNPRSVGHADVSGQVLFQGKPLPGGQVTFVTVKGGFTSAGPIDENGNYHIEAPLGEVIIGVDNQMLVKNRRSPQKVSHPKQPGEDQEHTIKGRFVDIPSQYGDPSTSGLKYTVQPGTQTHNIELSATPPHAPGS